MIAHLENYVRKYHWCKLLNIETRHFISSTN